MARITWQNVAAPDFRGIGQNYEVMSRLLGNAAQAGEGMLNVFRNAHQQAADRNILQRQAGVPNAAAFDGNAIIGQDGSHASLDTLRSVQNQRGDLLRQDILNQALQEAAYGHSRTVDRDSRLDAAREDIARNYGFGARGSDARVNNLYELPSLSNLDPGDLFEVMSNAQGLHSGRQATDRTTRLAEWDIADRQDITDALRAAGEVNAASSSQRARAEAIERQRRRLTPRAFALLEQTVQGQSGWGDTRAPIDMGAPATSAAPTTGGRASGALASVAGSGSAGAGGTPSGAGPMSVMTGGATLPNNIRTIGEFVENKRNLLRHNPAGTATGIYQITSDTWQDFAPKALGSNWRDADIRDPQVQDRVAREIWNASNRSARSIRNRWVSLTPAQAESLVGKSWEEARDLVSQGETSTRASEILSSYTGSPDGRRDPGQSGEQFTPEVRRSFRNYVGNRINGTRISESNLARMVEHFGVAETRRYLQSSGRQDPERNGVKMSEIAEVSAYADRSPEQTQASYVEDQLLRAVQAGRPSNNPLPSDTPQLFSNLDEEGREITLSSAASALKQDPVFAGMSMEDIQFHLRDLMDKADVKPGVAMRMMQESGTVPSTRRALGLPDTINPFDGFFGIYRRQGSKANVPELTRQIHQYRVDPTTGRSPVEDHISNALATQREIEQRQQVAQRIQELQGIVSAASRDPRQDNNVQRWMQEINALTHALNQMTEGSGGATEPTYEQQVVQEMYELLPPELVEEALAPDTLPARKEEIHSLYLQRKMAQERGAARTRELAEARQQRSRQESIERMRRLLEMEGRI